MANIVFADEPQTIELLQSMRILMRWLNSVPREMRQRFLGALAECSNEVQGLVLQMVSIVEDPRATSSERRRALAMIADALFLNPGNEGEYGQDLVAVKAGAAAEHVGPGREVQKMECQEAAFADRLRELLEVKRVTQQELSSRVGCSQPAISQMLNRKCRPQKKTILKLAEALQVQPQELWPDIEVAEMLDVVANFQQDDHVMTEAEAKALREPVSRNVPKIPVRSLPARQL
jgi:transcriptional regulator with XRE-family HTH domain